MWHVLDAGWSGVTADELQVRTNISRGPLEKALQRFTSQKKLILFDKENQRFLHADVLAEHPARHACDPGRLPPALPAQNRHGQRRTFWRNCPIPSTSSSTTLCCASWPIRTALPWKWNGSGCTRTRSTFPEMKKVIRRRSRRLSGNRPSAAIFQDVAPSLPGTPRQHQDVLEWMVSQGILIKVKEDILFSQRGHPRTSAAPGRLSEGARRDHHARSSKK